MTYDSRANAILFLLSWLKFQDRFHSVVREFLSFLEIFLKFTDKSEEIRNFKQQKMCECQVSEFIAQPLLSVNKLYQKVSDHKSRLLSSSIDLKIR